MTQKSSSSSRSPDQPALCPQCQALVTKNTLNEHFVKVHGRKEAIVGKAKPISRSQASRDKRQARKTNRQADKSTSQQENPASSIEQDPTLTEQIENDLPEGFVRCPDCAKKVKLELLAQHYQAAHKPRPGFKGKSGKGGKNKLADPEIPDEEAANAQGLDSTVQSEQ
jgi:endogenous inhibitor of DNA gyrase (YacG/DUF329 family)